MQNREQFHRSRHLKWIWVIVIAVIVIALGGFLYYCHVNNSDNNTEPKSTKQEKSAKNSSQESSSQSSSSSSSISKGNVATTPSNGNSNTAGTAQTNAPKSNSQPKTSTYEGHKLSDDGISASQVRDARGEIKDTGGDPSAYSDSDIRGVIAGAHKNHMSIPQYVHSHQ